MKKKLFLYLFFGCFGMTFEVFFVAITNLFLGTPLFNEPLWSLTGKTYVWMFPIYVMIPVLFGLLLKYIKDKPLALRLIIYTLIIYVAEFSSGFLLEQITGKCPWEYTTGWHIMGYIRLDYAPSWLIFSFIIEKLYNYINEKIA